MPIISKLEAYGIAMLILGLAIAGAYFKGHHSGYMEGKQEIQVKFDQFVNETKAAGLKAEQDKIDKEKEYAKNLSDSNAVRDRALASLRVEQARPRGGFVSVPAPGAGGDSKICFDRAALDAALRKLDTGVSGIVGQGDKALIDLRALVAAWPKN